VGAEMHVLPILSSQKSESGEAGGVLIPAEALGSLRFQLKSWSLGLAGGTGVPLSASSPVHVDPKMVRGPTSPLFRGLLDIRFAH
jgi:hypothetical protein